MKIRLILIIILTVVTLSIAATLTVTIPGNPTTPGDAAFRAAEAFGAKGNLGRNATGPEMSAMIAQGINADVQSYERNKSAARYVATPIEVQPTPTATATSTPTPTETPSGTPGLLKASSPTVAPKPKK